MAEPGSEGWTQESGWKLEAGCAVKHLRVRRSGGQEQGRRLDLLHVLRSHFPHLSNGGT
jgi:hypothetical protein